MISAKELREVLSYDQDTGEFYWRKKRWRCEAGSRAGTDAHNGYRTICINRRLYSAHRLAWLYVHGEWPTGEIDHRNGIKSDNRISNLRSATRFQNMWNKRRVRAASGVKGVRWHSRAKKWAAQICVNKRKIHLGLFTDIADADRAYRAAAATHFGEFMPDQ